MEDLCAHIARIERAGKSTGMRISTPQVLNTNYENPKSYLANAKLINGELHEVTIPVPADVGAATGFCLSLLSHLLQNHNGIAIWCQQNNIIDAGEIYPPALMEWKIMPGQLIILKLQSDKDVLWTMEESLRSQKPTAVIGEVAHANLTVTRRLQIAAYQNNLPALMLRPGWKGTYNSAASKRWRIKTRKSQPRGLAKELNEPGNPNWQAELYRCRGGEPGTWRMEWKNETNNLTLASPTLNRSGVPHQTKVT
ncbi:MAG: hypothetical protein CMM44_07010 [Rhodospirillaceae bacterium]|nr:hypothetical protein [Rhodospirillaceae bacterium]|tara:strand:- start:4292 stop:5050 length:759 start_codon:yes stop_codon:yes gene_type:complete